MTRPANRLGLKGSEEVKQHVWLQDIAWDLLARKSVVSPLAFAVRILMISWWQVEQCGTGSGCLHEERVSTAEGELQRSLKGDESLQGLFDGYDFCPVGS